MAIRHPLKPTLVKPTLVRLFAGLQLGGCDRDQLAHLGPNRLFRDCHVPGGEIGHDLVQDAIAGLLEFGRDDLLGIGRGVFAGNPELIGRPQSEQPVAAGLRPEFLLLVEGKLLLKAFFALVEFTR